MALVEREAVLDVVGRHEAQREIAVFLVVPVDEVAAVGLGMCEVVEAWREAKLERHRP